MIGCLVLFDVIGVAAAFIFDIAPIRGNSGALPYTIWFVLGVFCGILGYAFAGGGDPKGGGKNWADQPDSDGTSVLVLSTTFVLLAFMSLFLYISAWKSGGANDSYVPDNMGLTITFFVSLLGAMFVAHKYLRPNTTKPAK
jgi:hypothetical protein